jgi:serine/threonine protein kinase
MSAVNRCSRCGNELPINSPDGLCPACLLQAAQTSDWGTSAAESRNPRDGFTPPAIEQLAQYFPQFELIGLVGQGGMGAVYRARQPGLDRYVAIKILPPDASSDPAFAQRFTREARALAQLSHPNIVAVHDVGQSGGLYYLVMEFVDGVNLRQAMQAGQIGPAQAIKIVQQICDALQYAHDEGVVHRDIKPENILIDKKGRLKIADFGLAKLLGREGADVNLTATDQVMGTLRYMAPEQMQASNKVDHRADIYSLGVVFYELLTNEVPMGRFPAPSKKVQIDVRLDEVVLRALEREPDLRYQRVGDVKADVDTISRGEGAVSRPGASDLDQAVLAAFPSGKVAAIKVYRERTGESLAEAVWAVDRIAIKHGVPIPAEVITWKRYLLTIAAVVVVGFAMSFVHLDLSQALIGIAFVGMTAAFAIGAYQHRGAPIGWRVGLMLYGNLLFLTFWLAAYREVFLGALYRVSGVSPGQHDNLIVALVALGQLLWLLPTMIRTALKLRRTQVAPSVANSTDSSKPRRWFWLERKGNEQAWLTLLCAACLAFVSLADFGEDGDVRWWSIWSACFFFGLGLSNFRRPAERTSREDRRSTDKASDDVSHPSVVHAGNRPPALTESPAPLGAASLGLVTAGILTFFAALVVMLFWAIPSLGWVWRTVFPGIRDSEFVPFITIQCFVVPVLSVLVILAGLWMRSAQFYRFSIVCSIFMLLPWGVAWPLCLPLGIWSLAVLTDPAVKTQFEMRRQHKSSAAANPQ